MKRTLILFLLSASAAFSQVDCTEQDQNFSGKCESFNEYTGIRSKYSYKKGTLHGKFEESFQNGQQRSVGSYKSGLLNGKFSSYYITGEKMTEAKFKSGTGNFIMYHANGEMKTAGQFEEGRAAGTWNHFNANGDLTRESDKHSSSMLMYQFLIGEQSNNNEMAFGDFFNSFDDSGFSFSFGDDMDDSFAELQEQMNRMMELFSDSSFSQSFQFDTTFSFNDMDGFFNFKSFGDSSFSKSFHFDTIIGEMPQRSNPFFSARENDLVDFPDTEPSFIGGEDAMNAFIENEIGEKEDYSDGTVFIEAIVEIDGSISNSRVALGVNSVNDNEAMRIASEMPLWKPATLEGQLVRSRCIIPIRFNSN